MTKEQNHMRKCAADAFLREMTAKFFDSLGGPGVRSGELKRTDVEMFRKTLDFWLTEDAATAAVKENIGG